MLPEEEVVRFSGDTAYISICTALVFLMNLPGLALFYGGLVQSKHVMSVMMQCFGITCVCGLLWALCGYSLSFSGNGKFIGDLAYAGLAPLMEKRHTMINDIPMATFFLFQGTFAVITPALMVGTWAERAKFKAVLAFCALWEVLVYCPVCHWVWGGGFLAESGVRDFAGGLVVHATAGASAIVAARLLPPRPGFPNKLAPPHSLPMVMTGACMLWVGWFGFNGGSALHASVTASMAALTTAVSACTGAIVWLVIEDFRSKPTVEAAVTGMVAGLGSITPASGFVGVPGAVIIGLVAGLVCYGMTALIKERGVADDALDVFSVHGVGGIVGTLLTAPLSATALGGIGYDEGSSMNALFCAQLLGCVVTVVWSMVLSVVLTVVINKTVGFCHTPKEQKIGLDTVAHGGHAYASTDGIVEGFVAEARDMKAISEDSDDWSCEEDSDVADA